MDFLHNKHHKRTVGDTIRWHLKQGYKPIEIDLSDHKVSILVLGANSEDCIFPDTAFICFNPRALDSIKQLLREEGFDTLELSAN
ncbi:MAG: hypothetical protein DIU81_006840 [[Clostridium] cellulosi]